MRFGEQGELIIEGQTEAGVTAHYFDAMDAADLTTWFQPPLPQHRMGLLSFASSRIEDAFGTSSKDTHVISDPDTALTMAKLIMVAAAPNLIILRPGRLGRRAFLLKRLNGLRGQLGDLAVDEVQPPS